MNTEQIIDTLKELVINNSNLEAELDDVVAFDNVVSVESNDNSVVIQFSDCKVVLSAEIILN